MQRSCMESVEKFGEQVEIVQRTGDRSKANFSKFNAMRRTLKVIH